MRSLVPEPSGRVQGRPLTIIRRGRTKARRAYCGALSCRANILVLLSMLSLVLAGCVTERDLQVQRDPYGHDPATRPHGAQPEGCPGRNRGGIKGRIDTLTRSQAEQQPGSTACGWICRGCRPFDDLGRADATLRQDVTLLKDEFGLQVAISASGSPGSNSSSPGSGANPAGERADELYEKALQVIRDKQEPAAP